MERVGPPAASLNDAGRNQEPAKSRYYVPSLLVRKEQEDDCQRKTSHAAVSLHWDRKRISITSWVALEFRRIRRCEISFVVLSASKPSTALLTAYEVFIFFPSSGRYHFDASRPFAPKTTTSPLPQLTSNRPGPRFRPGLSD